VKEHFMNIFTGCHKYCNSPKGITITSDGGSQVSFSGPSIKGLVPSQELLDEFKNNEGQIPFDDAMAMFVKRYYEEVLSKTGPDHIIGKMNEGSILLSYEEPEELSYREVIAAFLELYYNLEVREVKSLDDGTLKVLKRNKHYQNMKDYLEGLIKENVFMGNYSCIAAMYLHEAALSLAKNPELMDQFPVSVESYERLADVFEEDYKKRHRL